MGMGTTRATEKQIAFIKNICKNGHREFSLLSIERAALLLWAFGLHPESSVRGYIPAGDYERECEALVRGFMAERSEVVLHYRRETLTTESEETKVKAYRLIHDGSRWVGEILNSIREFLPND